MNPAQPFHRKLVARKISFHQMKIGWRVTRLVNCVFQPLEDLLNWLAKLSGWLSGELPEETWEALQNVTVESPTRMKDYEGPDRDLGHRSDLIPTEYEQHARSWLQPA
ncbi:predicted protein [Histoplasma capsulatum var. duboisii H88]|uniref:Predicted protein n=1 Tax=Ajellomyces capsulatus (strain H88) TaxID=544711 RepID=F0UPG7_AJEC8|nr:predicted protein [Histoplasma capsulatum var. duboisii H88]